MEYSYYRIANEISASKFRVTRFRVGFAILTDGETCRECGRNILSCGDRDNKCHTCSHIHLSWVHIVVIGLTRAKQTRGRVTGDQPFRSTNIQATSNGSPSPRPGCQLGDRTRPCQTLLDGYLITVLITVAIVKNLKMM